MALKRRETRPYTMQDMFSILNEKFMKQGVYADEPIPHFVISPTCFSGEEGLERWLICDSRQNEDDAEQRYENLLPAYYGKTISEAVERAYLDRKNHG